jgi:DNA-binding NarL/FixJ family response regulator
MSIRVLLADDQPVVRGGFAVFINAAADLEVVGEAATGRAAVEMARTSRADVVVMDIRMPDLDGLAATRLITADPDLADTRVLILTTFEIDEYVFQALRAGASGFLGKGAEVDELLDAIRTVHRGDSLLSPAATRALIARFLSQPHQPAPATGALATLTGRDDRGQPSPRSDKGARRPVHQRRLHPPRPGEPRVAVGGERLLGHWHRTANDS